MPKKHNYNQSPDLKPVANALHYQLTKNLNLTDEEQDELVYYVENLDKKLNRNIDKCIEFYEDVNDDIRIIKEKIKIYQEKIDRLRVRLKARNRLKEFIEDGFRYVINLFKPENNTLETKLNRVKLVENQPRVDIYSTQLIPNNLGTWEFVPSKTLIKKYVKENGETNDKGFKMVYNTSIRVNQTRKNKSDFDNQEQLTA